MSYKVMGVVEAIQRVNIEREGKERKGGQRTEKGKKGEERK